MVLPEIKISVFGGENGRKPGDSGHKPGYSGFGTLRRKTPGINPDTPEISEIPDILDLSPDIPVLQNCGRRVVSGSGVCIQFRLVSKLQIIIAFLISYAYV